MNRLRIPALLTVTLLLAGDGTASADVKAKERNLVRFEGFLGRVMGLIGGRAAREGVESALAVKGDRKLTVNDFTGELVDLGEEKVYTLDMRKKTYEAVTFADMRRQMQEAQARAAKEAQRAAKDAPGEQAPAPPTQVELEVDFNVKKTGQKKTINGFETRQAVMTIALREKGMTLEQGGGLVLTSDMWLAPRVPRLEEVAGFEARYAQKLAGPAMAGGAAALATALAMYPGLDKALSRLQSETARLDGTPILTTTAIEAVKSARRIAEQEERRQETAPRGGLGGLLGRKLGKKLGGGGDDGAKDRTTIMTTTREILSVSAVVGAEDVALPAGFKQK